MKRLGIHFLFVLFFSVFWVGCVCLNVSYAEDLDVNFERATKLIVMVESQFHGANDKVYGAGIVFGRDEKYVYIVSANNLIRNGDRVAEEINVKLRELDGKVFKASVQEHFSSSLDLSVLRIEHSATQEQKSKWCVQYDRLADKSSLSRGARVFPVGYFPEFPWASPVSPDVIAKINPENFMIQSTFMRDGKASWAVVSENGELLGLMHKFQKPLGFVVTMDTLLKEVKGWGYPVILRKPKYGHVSPLLVASKKGDIEAVKILVAECHDVNERHGEFGPTPLHYAVQNKSFEMINVLLNAGATIDVERKGCYTPLGDAISNEHKEMIEFLLQHGADPIFTSKCHGDGAIGFAVNRKNVELLKLLLQARTWESEEARRKLHEAFTSATLGEWLEGARLLLDYGVDVNRVDNGHGTEGQTILHQAAWNKSDEVVKFLLEKGAKIDIKDKTRGLTPLQYTLDYPNTYYAEKIQLLVEAGANIDVQNSRENTPLHIAFLFGSEKLATFLIGKCANPYIKNSEDKLPMDLADKEGLVKIFSYMKDQGSFKKNQQCPVSVQLKAD